MISYNAQHTELTRQSKGKSWKFAELLPNMIIGFCPRLNSMSWAQPLDLLSVLLQRTLQLHRNLLAWKRSRVYLPDCWFLSGHRGASGRPYSAKHIALRPSNQHLRPRKAHVYRKNCGKKSAPTLGSKGTGPNTKGWTSHKHQMVAGNEIRLARFREEETRFEARDHGLYAVGYTTVDVRYQFSLGMLIWALSGNQVSTSLENTLLGIRLLLRGCGLQSFCHNGSRY